MTRSAPLLALVLALPLTIPLACSDDSIDAGSGGSGSTGTQATTGTNTGSTGTSTATNTGSGGDTSGTAGGTTTSAGGGGSGGTGAGGDPGAGGGTGGQAPLVPVSCGGPQIYACGDTIDNDGDGLADHYDPDCLGPCDDSEDDLSIGIPGGDPSNCRLECYFDQDSGAGNDDCNWNHKCDPLSVDPDYYPEPDQGDACAYIGADAIPPASSETCGTMLLEQSAVCEEICAPLVPNGCDCFGCCELPAGSGAFVWLGSAGAGEDENGELIRCTMDDLSNPAICHPCTPVQGFCYNPCEECELCIGKTIEDLPAHCFEGEGGGDPGSGGNDPSGTGGGTTSSGGGEQCPDGIQACGLPGQPGCDAGEYCVTGCCRAVPN